MAGSKRWFNYTTDTEIVYAIERDEELTELVNTGATAPAGQLGILPSQIEPRTVRYNTADGRGQRKIVILENSPAALLAAPLSITIDDGGGDIIYYLTSYIGERQRFVPIIDTGYTDGDAEAPASTP